MAARKYLKLVDKVRVIEEVSCGRTFTIDVAKEFQVGKSQVYKILKAKEYIKKATRCMALKCRYPAIDQAIFDCLCFFRILKSRKPLPVTRTLLNVVALKEAKI